MNSRFYETAEITSMNNKITIIDNLTETFNGPIVRSGLQKSSKLDARAFSKLGFDTTYIFCGNNEDSFYDYKKIRVDEFGAKDRAVREGKSPRQSAVYVKQYLKRVQKELSESDYIIAHCHSIGMITGLNNLVKDKNILFIIHDIIDYVWCLGFSGALNNLRISKRNNAKVLTNSRYSIDRQNAIFNRIEDKEGLLSGDLAFDGYIDHFVWTDMIPTSEEIVSCGKTSAVIGRYESSKYHHKLYKYRNPENVIVHYGIRDPRRDPDLKYYNKLISSANAYQENLSDEDLWGALKSSQSIILPCFHEGFGFTAFEAGIYGVIPVILTKPLEKSKPHQHATVEYLTRSEVKHFSADFGDEDEIFRQINESLNVTTEDRIEVSKNLLKYFTVENYVNDRLEWLNSESLHAQQMDEQIHSTLDDFFA